MSFYEGSCRVPLMICAPGMKPGLVKSLASCCDLLATIAELANIPTDQITPSTDGESLVSLAGQDRRESPVMMEYAAEASYSPMVSLRDDPWKYNYCKLDPEQLFDLTDNPLERNNLAQVPEYAKTLDRLRKLSKDHWDLEQFDNDVRQSQPRRWVVYETLRQGAFQS